MEGARASILVFSYKNLQYYKECLDSVLMQNYSNIEIIVSDDGTPDFNEKEISEYINHNKNENIKNVIIHSNSKNLGSVKNMNQALRLSEGEYIIPLAIDDMLFNQNTVTNIVKFFERTQCLIFTAYREVYDQTMQKYIERLPKENAVEAIRKHDSRYLYKKLCKSNFISGACTPFTREFINQYGYFDEEFFLLEDYPRYLNVTRNHCMIHFMDQPIIKYRLGGGDTKPEIKKLLEHDFIGTVQKEILAYKKEIGIFLYRLRMFDIKILKANQNIYKRMINGILYPDIVMYKLLAEMYLRWKNIK